LDSSSQDQLAAARSTAQEVMNTLRVICGELRPPALAPFGLEKAIRSHAGQVQELHPEIKIGLDLMPDGQSISERVRLALYRIYQHALLNVIRHAQARSVLVHFAFDSEQIELEVRDDGLGFEFPNRIVNMVREGHFGLVGAAERAQAIGGRLEVFSVSGKGTTVRVTVPRDESLQIPSTTQLAVFPLEE
jgi:signal transduction histidine kinase